MSFHLIFLIVIFSGILSIVFFRISEILSDNAKLKASNFFFVISCLGLLAEYITLIYGMIRFICEW